MLEYYPLPVAINCQADHSPVLCTFGLVSIDINVDGTTHQHRIEASEFREPSTCSLGDLKEALYGRGEWTYFLNDYNEDDDGIICNVTLLSIRVCQKKIVVRSKIVSVFPLNPLLGNSLLQIVSVCEATAEICDKQWLRDMFDS